MPTINFIWDEVSDSVLLETDKNNSVSAEYDNRPEQFGELLSQSRSGSTNFYHYDGESSTHDLTNVSEDITDTLGFTAYGEEFARSGSTVNPYGYKGAVGYYANDETNDIYVRARTYQPSSGRWLSSDPLRFIDGPNMYLAYFVPSGTDPEGALTVKDVTKYIFPKTGYCGHPDATVGVRFNFELKKKAGSGGLYVVQKIEGRCRLEDCDVCNGCPSTVKEIKDIETFGFFEKWDVPPNSNEATSIKGPFNDNHTMKIKDKTCAYVEYIAEARVYSKAVAKEKEMKTWKPVTGVDAGSCGTAGSNGIPGVKCPGRKCPPEFWKKKKPRESVKYKTTITYDCCGGGSWDATLEILELDGETPDPFD